LFIVNLSFSYDNGSTFNNVDITFKKCFLFYKDLSKLYHELEKKVQRLIAFFSNNYI